MHKVHRKTVFFYKKSIPIGKNSKFDLYKFTADMI